MNRIIDFLEAKLNLNDNGKDFINKLMNGDDLEKRLLVCIGIDVKFHLLDTGLVEEIINNINLRNCSDILKCFDEATENKEVFYSSNMPKDKKKLVRVIDIIPFIEYYYNKIMAGINEINESFELIDEIERGNLNNFYTYNVGIRKGNLVWATIIDELFDNNNLLPANDVVMKLGLGLKEKEYIYLEYPDTFTDLIFQPASISKNWSEDKENNYYLSYKEEDGYGRTRSHIGDIPYRMKEIVHNSIYDRDKYAYNIKYLGKFDNKDKNISNFVNEAIERFYGK